ncbi:hypothetical protein [Streptomyces antimycoticus]|uniref:hypothetical protein n=1 Tax=Streptomyces antimycoticus TaxID=68175 RepID=UPI00158434EE|nr:hypothetical protein [Streptomyces antimycoticus]
MSDGGLVQDAVQDGASGAFGAGRGNRAAASRAFPENLRTVGFADPLYDAIAVVRRQGSVLSPATRELARIARRMLLGH